MSLAGKHIYNRYFDEIQRRIRSKDAKGVMTQFDELAELVLNHTIAPMHYYYLLNGVDPNEWLSKNEGYKRYKNPESSPIFWLHKIKSGVADLTYGQVALIKMEEIRIKVRTEIEIRQEREDEARQEHERQEAERMKEFSVKGTPFDRNWKIRPPRKETR